jgi:hypothetical protein
MLKCLKHQWHTSSKLAAHHDIIARLEDLISELHEEPTKADLYSQLSLPSTPKSPLAGLQRAAFSATLPSPAVWTGSGEATPSGYMPRTNTLPASSRSSLRLLTAQSTTLTSLPSSKPKPTLIAKAYFCLAQWQQAVLSKSLDDEAVQTISSHYSTASAHAPHGWGKVWHKYGIFNMMALRYRLEQNHSQGPQTLMPLVVNAMHSFFKSVSMPCSETRHETLQVCAACDLLVLRLYGSTGQVPHRSVPHLDFCHHHRQ